MKEVGKIYVINDDVDFIDVVAHKQSNLVLIRIKVYKYLYVYCNYRYNKIQFIKLF